MISTYRISKLLFNDMLLAQFQLNISFISTSIYSLYTYDLNMVDYNLPYSEIKTIDFSVKSFTKLSVNSVAALYVIAIIPFIIISCLYYMAKYRSLLEQL